MENRIEAGPNGLYQVQWDPPQQALSQPTDESPTVYILSSPDPDHPIHHHAKQHQLRQSTPRMEMNYAVGANPGDAVFGYTLFLGGCLAAWVLYLLLPKGFRKQYFAARRKRYARTDDKDMPAAGYWLPVKRQQQQQQPPSSGQPSKTPPHSQGGAAAALPITPERSRKSGETPPSPDHPAALHTVPPNKIIAETMARLQNRGIRLVAHGVHCNPKRVWIKLDDESTSVTWQTEFPRRVPNQSGQVSIVLMRGSLHRIALCNVLYIDVGKKTNALQKLPESVPAPCCFSLLTQNGSLDLQANSKLERDALVSCFSMILDDVHTEDWRAIYEATPEPSLVNSGAGAPDDVPVGKGTMVMNL